MKIANITAEFEKLVHLHLFDLVSVHLQGYNILNHLSQGGHGTYQLEIKSASSMGALT